MLLPTLWIEIQTNEHAVVFILLHLDKLEHLQIFEEQSWDSQVAYPMVKQDCLFHVDVLLLTWMKYVNV